MSFVVPVEPTARVTVTVDFEGIVQGVGFRPTLHQLAATLGLGGSIQNRSGVVRLTLSGAGGTIQRFFDGLAGGLPKQARLDSVTLVSVEPIADGLGDVFAILPSEDVGPARVAIPADLVMCPVCAAEVLDPTNRRCGYPFTTCTDCGPRYTVVHDMPYDRERTTLAAFPLCEPCRTEYEDPADRRFHAESTACAACGPELRLVGRDGHALPHPLATARAALADGKILAVRGIGGFLLAVDATNRQALARLRQLKARPHKPFALMARSIEVARRFVSVSGAAERALEGVAAPIVVLDVVADGDGLPLDLITPDAATVGMMLPTSPLHLLLCVGLDADPTPAFDVLVMTSGNRGGEPVCISNAEAFERLGGIADLFLVHDREINLRNDDSLVVIRADVPQVWRRGRGYAPTALRLLRPLRRRVLAMGADLKNTVAIGAGAEVVLSPHIGDLRTLEANEALELMVRQLPRFLRHEPEVVAVDLHPDMQATRLGRRVAAELGLPVVEVQHHHAHIASCMAERGLEWALGLAFDGTGFGTDGSTWGAELLDVGPGSWRRLATFCCVPMPGGDVATLEPARQIVGRMADVGMPVTGDIARRLGVGLEAAQVWERQVQRGVNAPTSRAAGRLFDSVSALLGLAPDRVTYEGQAAIRLESAARIAPPIHWNTPELSFDRKVHQTVLVIDWWPTISRLLVREPPASERGIWALSFHRALARAALEMARFGRDEAGRLDVVLSGGVFMNRVLLDCLEPLLESDGFRVWTHRDFPPNDGGIALGQAVIAGEG